MNASRLRILAGRYVDSVALLAAAARLQSLDGIDKASAVMATPANVAVLVESGFAAADSANVLSASPNDLIVAVRGDADSCDAALASIDEVLRPAPAAEGRKSANEVAVRTLLEADRRAKAEGSTIGLTMISVPGPFAAGEAAKALTLGHDVFLFSDNVSLADEVALKLAATEKGLLVMGPDCGTAIVDGVPLGFANAVRRGTIAVIGASGTGIQEVTSRIHNLGGGLSDVYGTGGRDLADEVGGLSMLTALRRVACDKTTEVIVLVSKPPSDRVRALVLDEAAQCGKPVVALFLGSAHSASPPSVTLTSNLADAATVAVALAVGESFSVGTAQQPLLPPGRRVALGSRQLLRGAFCGGTFCYEAQLVLRDAGFHSVSNAPIATNASSADHSWSNRDHTLLDLGGGEFTLGRPHPMIAPDLRDALLIDAWNDDATAVVLFDVVLGFGASPDPIGPLLARGAGSLAHSLACGVVTIAHVCGTKRDSQGRSGIISALSNAGVHVADSNADAVLLAIEALRSLRKVAPRG